jgi:hypothetical protein
MADSNKVPAFCVVPGCGVQRKLWVPDPIGIEYIPGCVVDLPDWRCPTHADFGTSLLRERHNARRLVLERSAKALRKLAALRPDPPVGDECGDNSRFYYEMLAEQLEAML